MEGIIAFRVIDGGNIRREVVTQRCQVMSIYCLEIDEGK